MDELTVPAPGRAPSFDSLRHVTAVCTERSSDEVATALGARIAVAPTELHAVLRRQFNELVFTRGRIGVLAEPS